MTKSILIVDDEPRIREVVEYALMQIGFTVTSASGGREAVERVESGERFDLIVLDVLMPDLDGLEVCRRLRANSSTPIIFLSSRAEETDRIVGLELGGDDYVCKPFSPRELCARVRSVLRRTQAAPASPTHALCFGPIRLDVRRHVLEVGGAPVDVTATEFGLLATILEADGEVLSRRQLIDRAYGPEHHVSERTIDTHVKRLRRKLAAFDLDPIVTVTGVGYRAADAA